MKLKYRVIDWAGNLMNWGEFDSYEDGFEAIDQHVAQELLENGIDLEKIHYLLDEYPKLEDVIEKIRTEFNGEYYVEELTDYE